MTTERAEELVEALVELTLAARPDDLQELAELVTQRQTIVSELERLYREGLPASLREQLRGRLELVQERDQALLTDLLAQREELASALEQVSCGRAAARGYGGQAGDPTPSVRRVG